MIPVRGHAGAQVAVLGLGRTGRAAVQALAAGGALPLAWDESPEARDKAEAEGVALTDLERVDWGGVAKLVVSPGIPHLYPQPNRIVAAAMEAGVPLDNDIGLFFQSVATEEWQEFDPVPRVIAVTGSNGKSTTAALIHHILRHEGVASQLAGNIGRGVLDIDPPDEGGIVVLELSSYQTELARSLTPDIAVFTNLAPDHLDRHGGLGGYFAAKRRLFTQGGPDRAVVGVDEVEGRFLADRLSEGPGDNRVIRVVSGRKPEGAGWHIAARKGFLSEWRKGRQVASLDLRGTPGLPGSHNHQNACAAYGAVRALGLPPRRIEAALHTFEGLPHRSQRIAEWRGVTFVNDSKATNADSAAKALQAFPRVRWIAGGLGKEGGIASLEPYLGNVAKAYLIGHSARDFALQIRDLPHEICGDMATAVGSAAAEAEPGDTVLLAPAAASFDQYADFEARGNHFAAEVRRIVGETGQA